MHCIHCGKNIPADSKFCTHCGQDIKQESRQNGELLSINISKTQTVVLYEDRLTYKGETVKYTDVEGVSYLLTRTQNSINFIPTHNSTSFVVKIATGDKVYTIDSSTSSFMLFKGNREGEISQVYSKLVYICDEVLKPHIIKKIANKFDTEKQVKIGELTLTKEGVYKPRSFWRKPELMEWKDYFNTLPHQGTIQVLKSHPKKKFKVYSIISMSTMNAIILPDFLLILFQMYAPQKQDKDESETKSNGKNFCHSCAAPVNANDKFCIHCGTKLA